MAFTGNSSELIKEPNKEFVVDTNIAPWRLGIIHFELRMNHIANLYHFSLKTGWLGQALCQSMSSL